MGRLFVWLSGAHPEHVGDERGRFAGLGALVLIPAILGFVSMAYAVSTVAYHPIVYVAAGATWFFIVVAIDRYLISNTFKTDPTARNGRVVAVVIRYLLSIVVGVAVSHPLVMLWFDDSITEQLASQVQDKVQAITDDAEARKLTVPVGPRARELAEKVEMSKCLVQLQTAEQSGVPVRLPCGYSSGLPNCAERCTVIERQKRQLDAEIQKLRMTAGEDERHRQEQIDAIEKQRVEDIALARKYASQDYIARVEALRLLEQRSPEVGVVKWFMIVLFVVIDLVPVTLKLATPRGKYEDSVFTSTFTKWAENDAKRRLATKLFSDDEYIKQHSRYERAKDDMANISDLTIRLARTVNSQSKSLDEEIERVDDTSRAAGDKERMAVVDGTMSVSNHLWSKVFNRMKTGLFETP